MRFTYDTPGRGRNLLPWLLVALPTIVAAAPSNGPSTTASYVVQSSAVCGGFCSVVGSADANLALALWKQGALQVHMLCSDQKHCDSLRAQIRSSGAYGSVSAWVIDDNQLPYADSLINVLVVDSHAAMRGNGLGLEQVLQALVPLGTGFIRTPADSGDSGGWIDDIETRLRALGVEQVAVEQNGGTWVRFIKPWPADIDQWTHYLHGADGNPVAQDLVVGPPEQYQWIAGPMWQRSHETDSSISTVVTAKGKLFYIVDEAPISLAGDHSLPDKWFLVARDAFNGVLLWKVPIRRWGWREWKSTWFTNRPGDFPLNRQKRLVADGDRVYVTLGYHAPVSQLDAKTGDLLQTYPHTERTCEILYVDGTLVLSVLADAGVRVAAVNAADGKHKWSTEKEYQGSTVDYLKWSSRYASVKRPQLDPSLNTATDGKMVALLDGPDIVCLDFETGLQKWRTPFPSDETDRTSGAIPTRGNLWIGTMIVSDGVVIHASPNQLAAFSSDTGRLLWSQPKKYIGHLWYEWKDVFVIGDLVWTWSAELDEGFFNIGGGRRQRELWPRTVNGYDIRTGELKKQVPLGPIFKTHHHHRCYRNKATSRYILASRRGTEYVDLINGNHTVHNWVRGTCHVGMMPANGLQYAPPHPCQCYIEEKLSGFVALAPARGSRDEGQGSTDEGRTQRGPAFQNSRTSSSSVPGNSAEDWPSFRHDSLRTGAAETEVPDDPGLLWRVNVGAKVSPPIIAEGRVFVSLVDEHHVACLDAQSGQATWEYAAGARIDSPPTYHRGTVVFGSADGWVYCVRAEDGHLVWRFRAAPKERLIGALGQFESAWPVHGSVLVDNDTVYFAAGRSSQLDGGICLYGVRAATGELIHQTKLKGPDYAVDQSGQRLVREQPGDSGETSAVYENNFQLPMGSLSDVLTSDGTAIYMRSAAFDKALKAIKGSPLLRADYGFLEESYFKRTPWTFAGNQNYARLIVHDKQSAYFVRQFDTLRGLDPTVYFTPGSKGYLLFARDVDDNRDRWAERVPVRIRAMVLAGDHLVVAGPPDAVDPKDPLGAFEGRKGGLMYVLDAQSGKKLSERPLSSPPVFNGAAAARGHLYVAQENGDVTCFGKQ